VKLKFYLVSQKLCKTRKKIGSISKHGNKWQLMCKGEYIGSYNSKEDAEKAREALQSSM